MLPKWKGKPTNRYQGYRGHVFYVRVSFCSLEV